MIKAVIFDMDGLMFDTETMVLDVFPKIMEAHGMDPAKVDLRKTLGCDSSIYRTFEPDVPGIYELMKTEFEAKRAELYRNTYKPGEANKPGLEALVQYLKAEKIPFAIASSSARPDIEAFLGHAGFAINPDHILSGKEGFPSKPDPAIFLAAAEKLGADPKDVLVLEDSKYGILAADRGGFQSIWIPDKVEADEEMEKAIQKRMESLYNVMEYLKEENHGR